MTHSIELRRRILSGGLVFTALICTVVTVLLASSCQTYVPREELAQEYFNLGNAYFDLERYDQAAEYYRRALNFAPDLERANYNLARAMVAAGRYADAIALLQDLQGTEPDNVRLTETLAYAELRAGNRERAVSLYERVLERSPYRVTALYNLGVMARRSDNHERAVELLSRAREAAPDDMDVLYHLGLSLLVRDANDRAVAALERFTEESSQPALERLSAIAQAYEDARFFSRALQVYETILEREPERAGALFGRARILLTAAEQPEDGLAALEEALAAGFSDRAAVAALLDQEALLRRDKVREILDEANLSPAENADTNGDTEQEQGGSSSEVEEPPASQSELRAPSDGD